MREELYHQLAPQGGNSEDKLVGRPYILVLGTADWTQPIATNQHYVSRELCFDEFASVVFMESMALRRPQLTTRDVRRVTNRIAARLRPGLRNYMDKTREVPNGLEVRSPLVVPVHSMPWRLPNRRILHTMVRDWLSFPGPKMLWTYTPVTYGLESYTDSVVYHCVDLLGTMPGVDNAVIESEECRLAKAGAQAIASSGNVKLHLESLGYSDVQLWENVADTNQIREVNPLSAARVPGRVIFAGNLTPSKIDYGTIEALAEEGLEVRLAGPRVEGGGSDERQFASIVEKGVQYIGQLSLKQLAGELASASVGIIPYVINRYTMGVSPLKTYEYLAAGLPVVSTPVPAVHQTPGAIWVEQDRTSFVNRVKEVSSMNTREAQMARVKIAAQHSWENRGKQIRTLVSRSLDL